MDRKPLKPRKTKNSQKTQSPVIDLTTTVTFINQEKRKASIFDLPERITSRKIEKQPYCLDIITNVRDIFFLILSLIVSPDMPYQHTTYGNFLCTDYNLTVEEKKENIRDLLRLKMVDKTLKGLVEDYIMKCYITLTAPCYGLMRTIYEDMCFYRNSLAMIAIDKDLKYISDRMPSLFKLINSEQDILLKRSCHTCVVRDFYTSRTLVNADYYRISTNILFFSFCLEILHPSLLMKFFNEFKLDILIEKARTSGFNVDFTYGTYQLNRKIQFFEKDDYNCVLNFFDINTLINSDLLCGIFKLSGRNKFRDCLFRYINHGNVKKYYDTLNTFEWDARNTRRLLKCYDTTMSGNIKTSANIINSTGIVLTAKQLLEYFSNNSNISTQLYTLARNTFSKYNLVDKDELPFDPSKKREKIKTDRQEKREEHTNRVLDK